MNGHTFDPDITTRCRNLANTLKWAYGSKYAATMVRGLLAKYGGVSPDFERELTGLAHDAIALDAEGSREMADVLLVIGKFSCPPACPLTLNDEHAEALQAIKDDEALSQIGDARREARFGVGL